MTTTRPGAGARVPTFGLYLPQLRMSFARIEQTVLTAEGLGFNSVWFMDHLAAPADPEIDTLEGWTVATALAQRTARIRLGHLTLCDAFRHPAVLAKMAATLDVISDGRLDLGLGWGSVADELRAFGLGPLPARRRAERLVETLEILRRMFSGEKFSFRGRHFTLDGAIGRPVPVQDHIPIHIGGTGRRLTLPIASRYADWWNCPSYGIDQLEELMPAVEGTRVSVQHPIGLAPGRAQREAVIDETTRRFGSWGGLVMGTPKEVADQLAREAKLGVELFICQFSDFGTPRTLRLFAREVMPAVRSALGRADAP